MNKKEFSGVTNCEYLAKGKRGAVFIGIYKGKKAAIKTKLATSTAMNRIKFEGDWLTKLNKNKIGPKLMYVCDEYFIYEFVEGLMFPEYIEKNEEKPIRKMLLLVIEQLRKLDELRVDKEEMHHPIKHIIIDDKGIPTLIDFERAHYTEKPKNITQFCQYLESASVYKILQNKGLKFEKNTMIELAKKYKKDHSKINEIIEIIKDK